jgi:hypothetical protein
LRLQAHRPEFKNYTFTKLNFSGTATHSNDCFGFLEPQRITINEFGKKSMHFTAQFFDICNNVSKSADFNGLPQWFPSLCTCCNGMYLLMLKILKIEDIFKYDLDGGREYVQSL